MLCSMDPLGSFIQSSAEVLTSRDSEQDFSTIFRGANIQSGSLHQVDSFAVISVRCLLLCSVFTAKQTECIGNGLCFSFTFFLSLFFCCHCEMEYYKKEKLNIAIFCRLLWMWRLVFSGIVLLAGFLLLLLLMCDYKVLVQFSKCSHIWTIFYFNTFCSVVDKHLFL